ncbi:MAG TPA: hypothetical protein VH062_13055 [Polyangiaceae bacterium]|nr:hypothetical protein [Polyangiaceae bacterium]
MVVCEVRFDALASKSCLLHDEVIALMSASCHQGDYERARLDLANQWVPAGAWKALLTTREWACFGRIRSDLTQYDIHPPLFFWLMHVAGLLTGFGATTGGKLNIVIHAVALVALMELTRTLTRSRLAGVAAALAWSFSEVAFETTFMARQYELLGCLGVLAVLTVHRLLTTESRQRTYAALLAVVLACMTVTQWYGVIGSVFVGVVAAGLGVILLVTTKLGKPTPLAATRFKELVAALLGAQVLTVVLHPHIFAHYAQVHHDRFGQVDLGLGVRLRLRVTLHTLEGFFGVPTPDRAWQWNLVVLALFVACVLVPCWQLVRAIRAPAGEPTSRALADAAASLAIPLFAALVTVPYNLGLGSAHSMGARYLSLLWPFWALALVWPVAAAIVAIPPVWIRAAAAVPAFLLFTVWPVRHGREKLPESPPLCEGESNVSRALPLVEYVVSDNTHRGTFGTSIPFFRDDARVFAFPPPDGVVPERPRPPPLDEPELLKGLAGADVVAIFHHPGDEMASPHAAEDLRHAIDTVHLDLTHVNDWVFALERFDAFVTYRAPRRGGPPVDIVNLLRNRGSALPEADASLTAYAAVLRKGRVQKEAIARSGTVRLAPADVPPPIEDFLIVSGPADASVTVGGTHGDSKRPGFLVVLYDPATRAVVYHAAFLPVNPRQRPWSDVAARPTPR